MLLMLVMTAITLSLVACSEKNDNEEQKPDKPDTSVVVPTNGVTITTAGGKVEQKDLTIVFPEGTFAQDTKVPVKELDKGAVMGDDEVSAFYKVTLPVHTGKGFTLSIKADVGDRDGVVMVARTPCYPTHGKGNSIEYTNVILAPTFADGTYTVEVPQFENPADSYGDISFGLARMLRLDGDGQPSTRGADTEATKKEAVTRAGKVRNVAWHLCLPYRFEYMSAHNGDVVDVLNKYIRQSLEKLFNLNLTINGSASRDIAFTFEERDAGDYGEFKPSMFTDAWGKVVLNSKMFTGEIDHNELAKTIIHELHHYFTNEYDTRWSKAGLGVGSEWLVLTEAGGVWAERFMGNDDASTILKSNCGTFVRGYYWQDLIDGGIYTGSKNDAWQSHGYGMALLFEYFAQQFGEKTITELYDYQKYHSAYSVNGPYDCIDLYVEKYCPNLFTFTDYHQFLVSAALGELKKGISYGNMAYRSIIDITHDGSYPVEGDLFRYGVRVQPYRLSQSYTNPQGEHTLKGKELRFSETKEGAYADIYSMEAGSERGTFLPHYLGQASLLQPLVITDDAVLDDLLQTNTNDSGKKLKTIIVISYNSANSKTLPSQLIVTLGDPVPQLSLSKTECGFTADGGEEQIAVTTNCSDVSVTEKPSWCSASISGNTLTLRAEKNTTTKEREGNVVIMARNGSGEVHAKVKVAQSEKMSIGSNTDYKGVFLYYNLTYLGREKSTYMQKIPLLKSNIVTPAACTMSGSGNIRVITASGKDRWVVTSWKSGYIEDAYGNPTIEIRDTIWAETNWTFQLTVDMDNAVITTGSVTQTFEQIQEHYMQPPLSRQKDTRRYSFVNLPLTSIIFPVPYEDPNLWNPTRLIGHSFGVDSETGDMQNHLTEATWVHTADGVESTWTLDNLDLHDNWSFFIILTPKDDYVKPF